MGEGSLSQITQSGSGRKEIPQLLSIYMYRFLGKHVALASHRDVVRRRGTKAKMNVSTEIIHFFTQHIHSVHKWVMNELISVNSGTFDMLFA